MREYSVLFHPLAIVEYLDSVRWYENKMIGLGNDFVFEIENVIDLIEKKPKLFQIKKAGIREAIVKHFPYLIIYKIVEKEKHVQILSVFHTSRNPNLKKR